MATKAVTDVVYRVGPYDGTAGATDPLMEYQDRVFHTDDVFSHKRSTDSFERVNGDLSAVYRYVGGVYE